MMPGLPARMLAPWPRKSRITQNYGDSALNIVDPSASWNVKATMPIECTVTAIIFRNYFQMRMSALLRYRPNPHRSAMSV